MMKARFLCAAVIAAIFALTAFAQERYVKPIDEAPLDGSFLAFRTRLIAAAERRDVKHILGILDPQVTASFGGHTGVKGFKEYWKIERKDTKFWDEFLPVIRNGGMFYREAGKRQDHFTAPYVFQAFPDDLDAFQHSVIFGEGVNLREKPAADSKVLEKLSFNVVTETDRALKPGTDNEPAWIRIETLGGKKGWVKAEFVRSPIGYRAGFMKKRGVWKMTSFVAGD